MGSDAHVIVVGGRPGLIDAAKDRIDQLEQRWSRFIDTSEVNELNRRAGSPVTVSADTAELVERAIDAWRLSGGSVDPTVLGAVIRAGYDRSFEDLGPTPPSGHSLLGPGAEGIRVDGQTVTLPAGTGFDPGGIGKGLAADLVAAEAMADGAEGVCVNLGGDVRVTGNAPGRRQRPQAEPRRQAWTVAVEHAHFDEPIATLAVEDGAVATSTTLRRRWVTDGEPRHHLIDVVTGLPSDSDLELVTVVAARAWAAEVLAKAVLFRGSEHPFDVLGGTGAEGLVVDNTGRIQTSPGFEAFVVQGGTTQGETNA
jgi:FAD:protein FMN transferase